MRYSKGSQLIIVFCLCGVLFGGHLAWDHHISKDGTTGIVKMSMEAHFPGEYETINKAAIRNGIKIGSEDEAILYAIRFAERGRKGLEFGILVPGVDTLDKQAGWAAASIIKSRVRWAKAGKPDDFITFMGARYCPPEDHPLNANWASNVRFWAKELRTEKP